MQGQRVQNCVSLKDGFRKIRSSVLKMIDEMMKMPLFIKWRKTLTGKMSEKNRFL